MVTSELPRRPAADRLKYASLSHTHYWYEVGMSGRNLPLYCILTLISMQVHQKRDKSIHGTWIYLSYTIILGLVSGYYSIIVGSYY